MLAGRVTYVPGRQTVPRAEIYGASHAVGLCRQHKFGSHMRLIPRDPIPSSLTLAMSLRAGVTTIVESESMAMLGTLEIII